VAVTLAGKSHGCHSTGAPIRVSDDTRSLVLGHCWRTRHTRPTTPSRPRITGLQAIVSRIAAMSSSLVSGLTIAKRASVSPSCAVGTTKANSWASIRSDHRA
jgi:hypothetical protein